MMSEPTDRLYYENARETAFEAGVLERRQVKDRPAVILDRTCFYPTSGGQPNDLGTLNGITVCDVVEDGHEVVHIIEKPIEDERVVGEIDWTRRYDHMQQHTGQHILSGAFIKVVEAQTVSFHMGEEMSTLDIDRSPGTPEEWDAVEHQVNGVISRNLPVRSYRIEPDRVDGLNLRGVPDRSGSLRIVDIEGWDRTACGGTHCASTAEVGGVQIISRRPKRVHGGLYRVEFLCGRRAMTDYAGKITLISELTDVLGVGEAELHSTVIRLLDDRKQAERALVEAQERLLDVEATELVHDGEDVNDLRLIARVFPGRDQEELRKLAQRLVQQATCVALLGGGSTKPQLVFARSESLAYHMGELMRGATDLIGGRGGGRPEMAMGGGPDIQAIEQAVQWARERMSE